MATSRKSNENESLISLIQSGKSLTPEQDVQIANFGAEQENLAKAFNANATAVKSYITQKYSPGQVVGRAVVIGRNEVRLPSVNVPALKKVLKNRFNDLVTTVTSYKKTVKLVTEAETNPKVDALLETVKSRFVKYSKPQ